MRRARQYFNANRNLLDAHGDMSKKIFCKKTSVIAEMDKLPRTKHNLDGCVFDCLELPPSGGTSKIFKLQIQGTFDEITPHGQVGSARLFHRTMVQNSSRPEDRACKSACQRGVRLGRVALGPGL